MVESYDEAIAKIAACESANNASKEAMVSIEKIIRSNAEIFQDSPYEAAIAELNSLASKSVENISILGGEEGQAAAADLKKKSAGAAADLLAEAKSIFSEIEGEIERIEKSRARPAPLQQPKEQPTTTHELQPPPIPMTVPAQRQSIQQQQKIPHLGISNVIGNVHSEIARAVENAGSKKQERPLWRLSMQDQVSELERISIGINMRTITGEEPTLRAKIEELYVHAASEKPPGSGFQRNLFELRNQRLGDVMALLGMRGEILNKAVY